MRPIDADNLKRLVKEFRDDAPQSSIRRYVCNVVLSMLGDENQTPTIDAVPLIEIYRVIAGHSDYHGDNILAALTCIAEGKTVKPVRPLETGSRWIPVEEDKPKDFVSVLGHMTDAGDFPSVRECYLIDGQHFFFPALNAVHPVDKWKEMPPAIDTPAVDAVEWISVKDRLPDENTLVLCAGAKGGMFLGKIRWIYEEDGTAYCHVPNARSGRSATHWHPLPEPPKEV